MAEWKTWTGHERLHHTDHSIMSMNHSRQSWKSGSPAALDTDTYKKFPSECCYSPFIL